METGTSVLKVLVVEDQVAVACCISFVLKQAGHKVDLADNGANALEKIKAAPDAFDLIVTDNNMPRMNGTELVREVRKLPYRGGIVVLSAYLVTETEQTYRSLGVRHFVHKPFELADFRAVIGKVAEELAGESKCASA